MEDSPAGYTLLLPGMRPFRDHYWEPTWGQAWQLPQPRARSDDRPGYTRSGGRGGGVGDCCGVVGDGGGNGGGGGGGNSGGGSGGMGFDGGRGEGSPGKGVGGVGGDDAADKGANQIEYGGGDAADKGANQIECDGVPGGKVGNTNSSTEGRARGGGVCAGGGADGGGRGDGSTDTVSGRSLYKSTSHNIAAIHATKHTRRPRILISTTHRELVRCCCRTGSSGCCGDSCDRTSCFSNDNTFS